MNKVYAIRGLIDDGIETLKEEYFDEWSKYPEDEITEVADGLVPIYTHDLLQMAAEDFSLAVDVPECGPAFDGEPTPVNIIAANVYEAISNGLFQWWSENEEEIRERWEEESAARAFWGGPRAKK